MSTDNHDDHFDDTRMSVGAHLEELRRRLLKALLGLVLGFVVCLCFGNRLVILVKQPVENALADYYSVELPKPSPAPATQPGVMQNVTDEQIQFAEMLQKLSPDRVRIDRANREIRIEPPPAPAPPPKPKRPTAQVTSLGPAEVFLVYIKVSLFAGLLLASPYVFFQIWTFVGAGLYPHEKRFIHTLLPLSLGLFLAGAVFCFLVVLPQVLNFLLWFNKWMEIHAQIRIGEWLSFALVLPIVFGLAFQTPLVMLLLERAGIATVDGFRRKRRFAILGCFVAAMMLTPPDLVSQLMMAFPLVLLYEFGILLIRFRKRPEDEEEDDLDDEDPALPSEPIE